MKTAVWTSFLSNKFVILTREGTRVPLPHNLAAAFLNTNLLLHVNMRWKGGGDVEGMINLESGRLAGTQESLVISHQSKIGHTLFDWRLEVHVTHVRSLPVNFSSHVVAIEDIDAIVVSDVQSGNYQFAFSPLGEPAYKSFGIGGRRLWSLLGSGFESVQLADDSMFGGEIACVEHTDSTSFFGELVIYHHSLWKRGEKRAIKRFMSMDEIDRLGGNWSIKTLLLAIDSEPDRLYLHCYNTKAREDFMFVDVAAMLQQA